METPKASLVAFTGPFGSGKSTAARGLFPDFVRLSFAEPIRQMLVAGGLCSPDDFMRKEEPVEWLGGATPRRMMQTLGTEWGRDLVFKRIWIAIMERRVKEKLDLGMSVVIDDCRFNDEAEMVHRMGGIIVHIARESHSVSSQHSSEHGIDRKWVDQVIFNQLEWSEDRFQAAIRSAVPRFVKNSPRP
jgi:hypothetical protein